VPSARPYEGERVRGADLFCQMGGGKTQATELVKMAEMNEIEDGKVIVDRPDIGDMKEGDTCPWAFTCRWPAVNSRTDFEPILERQIHHLINYIQGIMHIGQRDIAWVRVSKAAIVEKGIHPERHRCGAACQVPPGFRQDPGQGQVTFYTKKEEVDKMTKPGPAEYKTRTSGWRR
jgi:acetyl-CoA synthase